MHLMFFHIHVIWHVKNLFICYNRKNCIYRMIINSSNFCMQEKLLYVSPRAHMPYVFRPYCMKTSFKYNLLSITVKISSTLSMLFQKLCDLLLIVCSFANKANIFSAKYLTAERNSII